MTSPAPAAPNPPARASLNALRPLLPYAWNYRGQIIAAIAALIVASAATLAVPIAVGRMIDYGFSEANAGHIRFYFIAMIGVVAVLALASGARYYSRDDARRARRRRSARRSLRPFDAARSQFLRRGKDRRNHLSTVRRHDPVEGDVRLVGLDRATKSVLVRRRLRDDGGDLAKALGLCAGCDSRHRAAALRGRARGARALAPCAGYARRRHRLRNREPFGGACDAGFRRGRVHRGALSRGGDGRLRRRAADDARARRRHHRRAVPRLLQRRRRAVDRRAGRDHARDERGRSHAIRSVGDFGRKRVGAAFRSLERGLRRGRRRRAHWRSARGDAAHHRPGPSAAPARSGAWRSRISRRQLRLSRTLGRKRPL